MFTWWGSFHEDKGICWFTNQNIVNIPCKHFYFVELFLQNMFWNTAFLKITMNYIRAIPKICSFSTTFTFQGWGRLFTKKCYSNHAFSEKFTSISHSKVGRHDSTLLDGTETFTYTRAVFRNEKDNREFPGSWRQRWWSLRSSR